MPSFTADSGSGLLPDGDYMFTVTEASLKTTKNGDEMITVTLEIMWGDDSYLIWENLVFTKKAQWKVLQFMICLGEHYLDGEKVDVEPTDLIGREGKAAVITEEYDGKKKNKVANFLEPDDLLGLNK
jgi:hypothetical protein